MLKKISLFPNLNIIMIQINAKISHHPNFIDFCKIRKFSILPFPVAIPNDPACEQVGFFRQGPDSSLAAPYPTSPPKQMVWSPPTLVHLKGPSSIPSAPSPQ